jgi:hypothetical protein
MLVFALIGLALAGGVGGVVWYLKSKNGAVSGPPAADLAKAIKIIWNDTYKRTDAPPVVTWIGGAGLNCKPGLAWKDDFGRCVAGLSEVEAKTSQVAWSTLYKLSTCALAHEFCHHYLYRTGQDPDPNHTGPAFAFGGVKDQANAALEAAGL